MTHNTAASKRTRLIVMAVAFAAVAAGVVWSLQEDDGKGDEPLAPDAAGGGDGAFDPPDRGGKTPGSALPVGNGGASAPLAEPLRRQVGPPLPEGTEVDVTVEYKQGTETRYEITHTMLQVERESQRQMARQNVYGITTRVTQGAKKGSAARVRLTIDWMVRRAIHHDGMQWEFDTRQPDQRVRDHPNFALEIVPIIAVVDVPVEFVISATGAPTAVDGAERWRELWIDAVESLDPGLSRKSANEYDDDLVLLQWSTWLFPPLGGGPMKRGEPRRIELLEDYVNAHYVSHLGPADATHDDGTIFRVRLLTKAGKRARKGASRSPAESAVAKVHVQGDADSVHAAWRFDREAGRLADAEIEAKFMMVTSYRVGTGAGPGAIGPGGVGANFQPVYLDIHHHTRVERVADPK